MDQTSSLSDLLLKGPAALGGILSQASGSNTAQDGLFCNLVSGTDTASAPLQNTPPVSAVAVSPSHMLRVSSPIDRALQSADDLSSVLHRILAFLRQNNETSSAHAAAASATPDAQNEDSCDATTFCGMDQILSVVSTIVRYLTDTAQNAENASTPAPPTKDLSDALMGLLTLMQLVVRALPPPATEDGLSTPQEGLSATIQDSMDAMDGLMAGMETKFADLFAADAALAATADSSATASPPFLALLDAAKTFAKEILEAVTQNSPSDGSAAPPEAAPVSDMAAQLAQIGTDIQNAMAVLKQQIKTEIDANIAAMKEHICAAVPDDIETSTLETPLPSSDDVAAPEIVQNTAAQTVAPATTPTTKTETLKITPAEISAARAKKTESPTESKNTPSAAPLSSASAAIANALASLQDDGDSSFDLDTLLGKEKFSSDENFDLAPALMSDGTQATGTYSFASTLSAFRTAHGGVRGLPSIVDQVLLQLNRNVKNGQSQMSLQLQPTDLGKISVKLDFGSDGKVQGTVVADNPKTLEMLQKDSRSLERALQDAGLRAEPGSLQFSLGGQKNPNTAGQTADGTGNAAGSGNALSAQDADAEIAELGAMAEAYYITPTGVNIRV